MKTQAELIKQANGQLDRIEQLLFSVFSKIGGGSSNKTYCACDQRPCICSGK